MCKRDEVFSSLLCFDIKLLYGRHPNGLLFFAKNTSIDVFGRLFASKVVNNVHVR